MVTVVIIINIIVYSNINFINTIINVTAMLTWQNWRALSLVFQQANNNLLPFRVRKPWTDLSRNEPEQDKTTKMTCAPTLIRDVTVRMKTDWANALADLSLCWSHGSFCWFCHALTQMHSEMCPRNCSIWYFVLIYLPQNSCKYGTIWKIYKCPNNILTFDKQVEYWTF